MRLSLPRNVSAMTERLAPMTPVLPPNRMRLSSGARRMKSTLKFQSMKVRLPGSTASSSDDGNGSVAII